MPENDASHDRVARATARARLLNRLWAEDSPHAARLESCGEPLFLRCCTCGCRRRVEKRCDLKWCPSCQHALALRTCARYQRACAALQWPLFVTFTCRNFTGGELGVREIRRAFGKLRRLRWWRARVKGGVAGLEVTNRGKGWHAHIHALIDCRWFAVDESEPGPTCRGEAFKAKARRACAEVAEQWSLALGGRRASVKPRRVWKRDGGDIGGALREVLKYAITSEQLDAVPDALTPLLDEISKTRMVTSWGTCYGLGGAAAERPHAECNFCHDEPAWLPEDIYLAREAKKPRRRL